MDGFVRFNFGTRKGGEFMEIAFNGNLKISLDGSEESCLRLIVSGITISPNEFLKITARKTGESFELELPGNHAGDVAAVKDFLEGLDEGILRASIKSDVKRDIEEFAASRRDGGTGALRVIVHVPPGESFQYRVE